MKKLQPIMSFCSNRVSSSKILCILVLFGLMTWLWSCTNASSSDAPNDLFANSIFDKFYCDKAVDIIITTDLDSLNINKESEAYQSAKISFVDNKGTNNNYNLEISSRGETRKRYCAVFPLHLKFPEELLTKTELAKYKKIKLVRPCDTTNTYVEYILREYLCYKLYRILTEKSFRTQMARVTLEGNGESNVGSLESHYTFLIEDKKQVAKRLQMELINRDGPSPKLLDQENYILMTMFQYMIGNTDWNISRQHNIRVFLEQDDEKATVVPYDFDYSGFVNADYAIPFPNKPGRTVRDRFFQWRGTNEGIFEDCVKIFYSKKKEILSAIKNCPYSSDFSKKYMTDYIQSFYKQIESENALALLKTSTKI